MWQPGAGPHHGDTGTRGEKNPVMHITDDRAVSLLSAIPEEHRKKDESNALRTGELSSDLGVTKEEEYTAWGLKCLAQCPRDHSTFSAP